MLPCPGLVAPKYINLDCLPPDELNSFLERCDKINPLARFLPPRKLAEFHAK